MMKKTVEEVILITAIKYVNKLHTYLMDRFHDIQQERLEEGVRIGRHLLKGNK